MSGIWQALRQVRWQDVVDVAILTTVLYRTYAWLRGTVALQVALGMLTLVAAAYGAHSAGLVLTAYVLQAVGAVSVLVAVVIFREEIRRALGRASPLRWWRERRGPVEPAPGVLTRLAEALFDLAKERTGALIVLPRHDPVGEHLTGGTQVDGLVSPQLLAALFAKSSPVHDGAAVVAGDRLRVAGAFLPLTTSTELAERYGTRHRAAVGLSERCDALVLAVSEERGEVSLAEAGRIVTLPPSAAVVGRRLQERLREGGPVPARIAGRRPRRRAIIDSVVLAVILVGVIAAWNVVANRRGNEEERIVAVALAGVPAGTTLAARPSAVKVLLRGPRRLLIGVTEDTLHASVDASALKTGVSDLPVTATAPAGVEIVEVDPPRVSLLERRRLRVEPVWSARSHPAFHVEPAEVELGGRPGAFKGETAIHTKPIDRDQAKAGVIRAELVLRDGVRLDDDSQREVDVLLEEGRTERAGEP